jgi:hypothetical protein
MIALHSLWLPILLSAIVVFFVSSIIHMATPWHAGDYAKAPDEDKLMEAVRGLGLPPGDYMVPRPASRQDVSSAAFKEKMAKGPVMVMTVMPGGPVSMGTNLVQWFLYALVMGLFAAYVASRALPVGADSLPVLRFAGATAFIGYSAALWQFSIWYRRSWITTLKSTLDGLVYALITGGILAWLWPR